MATTSAPSPSSAASQASLASTTTTGRPRLASRSPSGVLGSSSSSSSSSGTPLPPSHPLSLKLRSILTTRHDAAATKQALEQIANLYPSSPSRQDAKGKHRAQDDDDDGAPLALIDASPSPGVDIARARANVKRDTERRIDKATDDFIGVLSGVELTLQRLTAHVADMRQTCDEVQGKLKEADRSSAYLLEHAQGLMKQRTTATQQEAVVSLFLDRFMLTEQQLETLASREQGVGPDLFAIMDRLAEIREDCKYLLAGAGGEVTQAQGEDVFAPRGEGAAAGAPGDVATPSASSMAMAAAGTRAGIDIMETTSSQLDQAEQKIFKWLCFEFRQPFKEGQEVGPIMREAVKRLSEKEQLLRPAIQILASTRASQLSTAFQRALTVGGPAPSFLPRPIELHAHDPLRYVGDMLAWVHQAVASEREFLLGLFGRLDEVEEASLKARAEAIGSASQGGSAALDTPSRAGGRRVGERRRGFDSVDMTNGASSSGKRVVSGGPGSVSLAERTTREVLDRVLEGCGRPLKIRVLQTVESQEGCLTAFHLASLVQFYRVTMDHTIGRKAALSKVLSELSTSSYAAFERTLERQALKLESLSEPLPSDLTPPQALHTASATLKELLSAHASTLSDKDQYGDALPLGADLNKKGEEDEGQREQGAIDKLMEPMLGLCERMAAAHADPRSRARGKSEATARWEADIFWLNCAGSLKNIVAQHDFAMPTTERLNNGIRARVNGLVDAHAKSLLEQSGLAQMHDEIVKVGDGKLSLSVISKPLSLLKAFLSTNVLLMPSSLHPLAAPSLRDEVHQKALEVVARTYGEVTWSLGRCTAEGEWERTRDKMALPKEEEVRVLLGV